MKMNLFLVISLNALIIPNLIASGTPHDAPPLGSKDWLTWALAHMTQKPPDPAAASATATDTPASSDQTTSKQAVEDTVRTKVIFKEVNKPTGYFNRCPCEFQTMVDYIPAGDETVEDFYKQKISLALWLALKKQIEAGIIQCTKSYMYQPPEMFANRGVIKFPPKRVKCQKTAPHLSSKEFEIEVRHTYDHIPVPALPATAAAPATMPYIPHAPTPSLQEENAALKNTVKELQQQVAALLLKQNSTTVPSKS